MPDAVKNFAYSRVAVAPATPTAGTSLEVTAAEGADFPATPFNAVIWPYQQQPRKTNAEVVRVTGRAGDVLTIVRTQESSQNRTVLVGDQISATVTAKTITDRLTKEPAATADNTIVSGGVAVTPLVLRSAPGQDFLDNPLFELQSSTAQPWFRIYSPSADPLPAPGTAVYGSRIEFPYMGSQPPVGISTWRSLFNGSDCQGIGIGANDQGGGSPITAGFPWGGWKLEANWEVAEGGPFIWEGYFEFNKTGVVNPLRPIYIRLDQAGGTIEALDVAVDFDAEYFGWYRPKTGGDVKFAAWTPALGYYEFLAQAGIDNVLSIQAASGRSSRIALGANGTQEAFTIGQLSATRAEWYFGAAWPGWTFERSGTLMYASLATAPVATINFLVGNDNGGVGQKVIVAHGKAGQTGNLFEGQVNSVPKFSVGAAGEITSAALTATRVPFAATGGLLADHSGLVYDTSLARLTVTQLLAGRYVGSASDLHDFYMANGTTLTHRLYGGAFEIQPISGSNSFFRVLAPAGRSSSMNLGGNNVWDVFNISALATQSAEIYLNGAGGYPGIRFGVSDGGFRMGVGVLDSTVATLLVENASSTSGRVLVARGKSGQLAAGSLFEARANDNTVFFKIDGVGETLLGTTTAHKWGSHGSTPTIQRAGAAQVAVAATAATNITPYGYTQAQADAIVTLLNEVRAVLVEKGIMKGAA